MLKSAADIIDALGGNAATAKALGVPYNSVTNWRMFGRFPAVTYVQIQHELRARGYAAPDSLWGMRRVVNGKAKR